VACSGSAGSHETAHWWQIEAQSQLAKAPSGAAPGFRGGGWTKRFAQQQNMLPARAQSSWRLPVRASPKRAALQHFRDEQTGLWANYNPEELRRRRRSSAIPGWSGDGRHAAAEEIGDVSPNPDTTLWSTGETIEAFCWSPKTLMGCILRPVAQMLSSCTANIRRNKCFDPSTRLKMFPSTGRTTTLHRM